MKKLFVLILTFVLLVSVASVSFAAVTIGGNLRVWYYSVSDGVDHGKSLNTLAFDRFALTFASDLGENNGIKGEVQFRAFSNKPVDTRLDSGYYYQKKVFMDKDELDIGAFSKLPFVNGTSAMQYYKDGIGSALKIANCNGIIYSITETAYDFAFGFCEANLSNPQNVMNTAEGFDYSMRFNYKPMTGVKIGAGYQNQISDYSKSAYKVNYVVDASYAVDPVWAVVECGSSTLTTGEKSDDALTAVYVEGGYKMGVMKFYAGRMMTTSDSKNGTKYFYKNEIKDGNSNVIVTTYDTTVFGFGYQINKSVDLVAEYQIGDTYGSLTKSPTALGCRLRASF